MKDLPIINKLHLKVAGISISVKTQDNLSISLIPERTRLLAFKSKTKAKADYILKVIPISQKKQFPKLLIKKCLLAFLSHRFLMVMM